jgi:hypothetical protein
VFSRGILPESGRFQKQVGHPVKRMLSKRNPCKYAVKLRPPDRLKKLIWTGMGNTATSVDSQRLGWQHEEQQSGNMLLLFSAWHCSFETFLLPSANGGRKL